MGHAPPDPRTVRPLVYSRPFGVEVSGRGIVREKFVDW
jgi:hypothetical protein